MGSKITKDESRDTGMAIVLLLLLVYTATRQRTALLAAITVHVVNMIWPRIYAPLAVVWFGLSRVLAAVVPKVLLFLVFFLIITPIGALRRLAGKDALKLRAFKSGGATVMVERNHVFVSADLENPY